MLHLLNSVFKLIQIIIFSIPDACTANIPHHAWAIDETGISLA